MEEEQACVLTSVRWHPVPQQPQSSWAHEERVTMAMREEEDGEDITGHPFRGSTVEDGASAEMELASVPTMHLSDNGDLRAHDAVHTNASWSSSTDDPSSSWERSPDMEWIDNPLPSADVEWTDNAPPSPDVEWTDNPLSVSQPSSQAPDEGDEVEFLCASPEHRSQHELESDPLRSDDEFEPQREEEDNPAVRLQEENKAIRSAENEDSQLNQLDYEHRTDDEDALEDASPSEAVAETTTGTRSCDESQAETTDCECGTAERTEPSVQSAEGMEHPAASGTCVHTTGGDSGNPDTMLAGEVGASSAAEERNDCAEEEGCDETQEEEVQWCGGGTLGLEEKSSHLDHSHAEEQEVRDQQISTEVRGVNDETETSELTNQSDSTVERSAASEEQTEQLGAAVSEEESVNEDGMMHTETLVGEEERAHAAAVPQGEESEWLRESEEARKDISTEQTEEPMHLQQHEEVQEPDQSEQAKLSGALEQEVSQAEEAERPAARDTDVPEIQGGFEKALEVPVQQVNGGCVDREEARRLAERLYRLDDVRSADVVKHMDKDTEFSRAVGEEYLKFFDFTGQNLDQSLRSFLKVVVLIGETQERERVLNHFSRRFHQCNPDSFSSQGAVLTLTCALMLLNTDLHGQNVGKSMSLSSFVSNLDTMNDGENFCKDLLKSLYNSIKNEPLEWAVDEEELKNSLVLPGDEKVDALLRSKSNPFQDVPHDKKATVYKQGFLTRKAHADIDGKRTPWGKRSWKTFYAVLKGMVLYLQKDEYRMEWQSSEEVVSVHHSLAEKADDYTKKPHVFRLQTADWRVFLFQAPSAEQMNSWIARMNLVSARYSSPPFPAAVGSQRKFSRPILPATQSSLSLEKQLQSHFHMLGSFSEDLAVLLQSLPEGRKSKAREVEDYRMREEYLHHERSRYEVYNQMLQVWRDMGGEVDGVTGTSHLDKFDREICAEIGEVHEDDEAAGLKKSHSSPSLNLELAPPPVVKVKRNISERRTYRKIIIPRRNREL